MAPQPRQLTGNIATLVRPRPHTGTDADWHTVTSDQEFGSMQREFHDSIRKGTGSSLADVSDVFQREDSREYRSTERIIQHPHNGTKPTSYRLVRDKLKNDTVLVPKFGAQSPGTFPQNATRGPPQTPSKAPEPTSPGFSALFNRDDGNTRRPNHQNIYLDLESRPDSYQTLDSDANPSDLETGNEARGSDMKTAKFRWSRIRENLGREPPKTTPTIWDQPLYKLGIKNSNEPKKLPHVPHDEFLGEYSRLPFRLISLPEASMLQHFRRQRGEEDHTEPARSMTSAMRLTSASTMDSSGLPRTPSPVRLRSSIASTGDTITRPALGHQPAQTGFQLPDCKSLKGWMITLANTAQRARELPICLFPRLQY